MKKILLMLLLLIVLFICACGHEHTFKEATCEEPKHCTGCEQVEGEALGHSFSEANCTEPATCVNCGKTGEVDPDNHMYSEATCALPAICRKCGRTNGTRLDHQWDVVSCTEKSTCVNCGVTDSHTEAHQWKTIHCMLPRQCEKCGTKEETALGHIWKEATCFEPKICETCNDTEGEPAGHSWQSATCQAPETCKGCGETRGEKMEHDWIESTYIEPNKCLEGKYVYTCVYGDTMEIPVPVADTEFHHCNLDGVCSKCETAFDLSKMKLESIVVATNVVVARAGVFTSTQTSTKIYKTIVTSDINMPIIDLNGDISRASKNTAVTVDFAYDDGKIDFESIVEVRIQGASSAYRPKKNYSIKLIEDDGSNNKVKLVNSWGKQHKYCLKANYVDFSAARNVVSAQIFGDIVRSRNDELYNLPNGGAIDGYPVLVYNDGKYQGLYTLNIPKNKWMFGMKDSDEKNQAIVMAIDWTSSVAFRAEMANNKISSGWELEFASNEDSLIDNNTDWVAVSLNNLIRFVMGNDGDAFKNGISQYADIDKCIDSMLYTFVICADDNISKNILWVTLDGTVWFSSMYDMDGTWGMKWNGDLNSFNENTHSISNLGNGGADAGRSHANYNLLWEKIYINFFDKVVERYQELRYGALSYHNISERFRAFFAKVSDLAYEAEKAKWIDVPSQNTNNIDHILEYARKRLARMDEILVKTE